MLLGKTLIFVDHEKHVFLNITVKFCVLHTEIINSFTPVHTQIGRNPPKPGKQCTRATGTLHTVLTILTVQYVLTFT